MPVERVRAWARRRRSPWPCRSGSPPEQVPALACASPHSVHRRDRARPGPRAASVLTCRQVLLAVGACEVEREVVCAARVGRTGSTCSGRARTAAATRTRRPRRCCRRRSWSAGDCAGVPVNGSEGRLRSSPSPHASGLAIGASAPPLKCRIRSLNGCSGFSVNVVVSCPVLRSGVTVPFDAHRDAVARGLGVDVDRVRRSRDRTGFGSAEVDVALQGSCREGRARSGWPVPIFERFGTAHAGSSLWIRAWAGVQASRPAAAEGLSVMPSGSVTLAVFTCEESSSRRVGVVRQRQFGRDAVGLVGLGGFEAPGANAGRNGTSCAVFGADRRRGGFFHCRAFLRRQASTSLVVCGPTPVHEVGVGEEAASADVAFEDQPRADQRQFGSRLRLRSSRGSRPCRFRSLRAPHSTLPSISVWA